MRDQAQEHSPAPMWGGGRGWGAFQHTALRKPRVGRPPLHPLRGRLPHKRGGSQ